MCGRCDTRAETPSRMVLGGSRDRLVALGHSMLPGAAAGELIADPRHALQVTYGCPPAFRAKMFPFAISLSATFSNSASAKNRLSVAFSRSRSLSRLTSSRRTEWQPAPRGVPKELVAKAAPTIFTTTRFSYAAAETAIERPGPQCVPVAGRIEALLQVEGL